MKICTKKLSWKKYPGVSYYSINLLPSYDSVTISFIPSVVYKTKC